MNNDPMLVLRNHALTTLIAIAYRIKDGHSRHGYSVKSVMKVMSLLNAFSSKIADDHTGKRIISRSESLELSQALRHAGPLREGVRESFCEFTGRQLDTGHNSLS